MLEQDETKYQFLNEVKQVWNQNFLLLDWLLNQV